jgi:hypothetical protein
VGASREGGGTHRFHVHAQQLQNQLLVTTLLDPHAIEVRRSPLLYIDHFNGNNLPPLAISEPTRNDTNSARSAAATPDPFKSGVYYDISRIITLISTLPGGQSRYFPLLHTKLSEVLPNVSVSWFLNLAENFLLQRSAYTGLSNISEDGSTLYI